MTWASLLLLIIFALGLLARSLVIATSAALLLVIKSLGLEKITFPWLEKQALDVGLVFLMLAVLVPLADDRVSWPQLRQGLLSAGGLAALVGGLVATRLNLSGLRLLQEQPSIMVALVVGCILGVVWLGGIPVGPLMAAGLAALLLGILSLFGL